MRNRFIHRLVFHVVRSYWQKSSFPAVFSNETTNSVENRACCARQLTRGQRIKAIIFNMFFFPFSIQKFRKLRFIFFLLIFTNFSLLSIRIISHVCFFIIFFIFFTKLLWKFWWWIGIYARSVILDIRFSIFEIIKKINGGHYDQSK